MVKVEDTQKDWMYGPNKRILYIGIIILIVSFVILIQALIFLLGTLFLTNTPIEEIISSLLFDDPVTLFFGIITLVIGAWLATSGAEAVTITKSGLHHKKLLSTNEYLWKDYKDQFALIIRSSQPEFKGKKGSELWQIEIQFQQSNSTKKSVVSVPEIEKEKEVVLFIRNLRKIANAIPIEKKDTKFSLITGKNQTLMFKIDRKSVKDLYKSQKGKKTK